MNCYFLLIEIILVFGLMILFYKFFKKTGLYLYIALMSSVLGVLTFKSIDILSFQVNVGIIIMMGIFISNNIIIQRYGLDEIKKIIYTFLGGFITPIGVISLANLINSSVDFIDISGLFDTLFSYSFENIRVIIANIISIAFMIWYNGIVYYYIRRIKNNLVFSNIGSILIIQFIEAILFVLVAYMGSFQIVEIFGMIVIRYLLKLLVGILGLVPVFTITKMKG